MRTSATGPGSTWGRRLREPGWILLPLRAFLGVTFVYAGLQKFANPAYLDPHSPTSVARQMQLLQHFSPIGGLLGIATHAPTLVGLAIAGGELAVGLGTLLGLYQRVAAIGGAVLSLTFFLTVSWNTTPYYYGSDIVFVFAWLTLLGFGASSVLSLDALMRARARAALRLGPEPATVPVSAARLRALCPRAGQCGMRPEGECARIRGCPVFPVDERLRPETRGELDRRTVIGTGTAALLTAGGALALGGVAAGIGRAVGGTSRKPLASGSSAPLGTGSSTSPSPVPATPGGSPSPGGASGGTGSSGVMIGATTQVPLGQARQFTDPASGSPAWMVHPSGSTFVAFSAICTHAGCEVQYDPSAVQFVCPCHGGVYDARSGKVLQGPPPTPLPAVPVRVVNGQLWVDG